MKALLIGVTVALGVASGPVLAQSVDASIKARQGQFRIMALNLGALGAIAKGEMEYDAELAQAAAGNLVTISQIDQRLSWPEGSDQMGSANTRAKAEIWENLDDVIAKWQDFGTAAASMQQAAAQGPDEIRAAMGALGGTCKACHEQYRTEN